MLTGEAICVDLELHRRVPPVEQAEPWAKLEAGSAQAALVSAAQESVRKLGRRTTVRLASCADGRLTYVVTAYRTFDPGWLTPGGAGFERVLLDVLDRLSESVGDAVERLTEIPVAVSASWRPGPGLRVPVDVFSPAGTPVDLGALAQDGRAAEQRWRSVFWIQAFAAVVIALFGSLLAILADSEGPLLISLYALPLALGALAARARLKEVRNELQDIRDQQDLAEMQGEKREQRAQKLFQVHSHQLKRYYDQALRQRGLIFVTGLLCIVAGFAVIALAFTQIDEGNDTEKIIVAVLGAVGGVLGNFIGLIYLRMFTETVKSIGSFHDRLVFTHHLHFANFLASKVASDTLRDQTLAGLAQAISSPPEDSKAQEPEETPAGEKKKKEEDKP